MIAEFMQFYTYSLEQVLAMYAVTFYALCAGMQQLKASQSYEQTVQARLATVGGDVLEEYLHGKLEQSEGQARLLRQSRLLKQVKGK